MAEQTNKTSMAQLKPVVDNPFGQNKPVAIMSAAAESDASRVVAQVQAKMLIAQRFPRNPIVAMDAIINAFTRDALAEAAQYQYARGGTDIKAPSIRALEAISQLWGHIHSGVEELDRRDGFSTVRTFAFDAQTGSEDSKTFQVEHVRFLAAKDGKPARTYKLEDPRDVYEHIANQAARRKRACMIAVIPGDVIEQAMNQAELTLTVKSKVTPERLKEVEERFAEFGVTKAMIEKRIQRRLDAMTPAQLVNLRKIINSLREEMSGPADWFDLTPGTSIDAERAKADTKPDASEPNKPVGETKPAADDMKAPPGETKVAGEPTGDLLDQAGPTPARAPRKRRGSGSME